MKPDDKEKGSAAGQVVNTSTRAEQIPVGSEDQGAEVASATEREAVADDYEASARISDTDSISDFSDEESEVDRPDTAAIANEEEET